MSNIVINEARKLSVKKYFEKLQSEFIIAKIRSQIYPKSGDREYWKKVMIKKQEKIADIAERNKIPSIFTDQSLMKKIEHDVKGTQGFPMFSYKDQVEYNRLYSLDLYNYYHKGTEVRVNPTEITVVFGAIEKFDQIKSLVLVKIENEDQIFHMDLVTRIL